MTSFLSMHREMVCSLYCGEYNSCLYYSYSDVDALCFLCIYNDDATFNHLQLDAVDENRENDVIQLRRDVTAVFATQFCSPLIYNASVEIRFNFTTPRITRIELCESDYYVMDICGSPLVSGFRLYVNGEAQEDVGSCLFRVGARHGFDLAENEMILHVKAYWYELGIVPGIQFYSNLRSFGSFNSSNCQVPAELGCSGYNFLGFYGWAGWGINNILGCNFDRC